MSSNKSFVVLKGDPDVVVWLGDDRGLILRGDGFFSIGHCMSPVIQPGDSLKLEKVEGQVKRGWVVVFPWKGQLRAHRVIKTDSDSFWARGDNLVYEEGPVGKNAIVGRVVSVDRGGERIPLRGGVFGVGGEVLRSELLLVARKQKARFRGLASLVDKYVFGSHMFRWMMRFAASPVMKDVTIEKETSITRGFGEVASQGFSNASAAIGVLEKNTKEQKVILFDARSRKGRRLGTAVLCHDGREANKKQAAVLSVWVLPGFRGLGLGAMMLRSVLDYAQEEGCWRVLADVDRSDLRTLGALKKVGFMEDTSMADDERLGDMEGDSKRIRMERLC